jgi:pimeloyl-ACP methyl ester carboxylesterase
MESLPSDFSLPSDSSLHPVGYYEVPMQSALGEETLHVWLPLKEAAGTHIASYKTRFNMAKKIPTMTAALGIEVRLSCFPTAIPFELPPWSPPLGAATPADAAAMLRGLVIMVHGLGDGPLVLAHFGEYLAALGFVVVAPAFPDAGTTDDPPPVVVAGRRFFPEWQVCRMHTCDAAIALLRATYGELQRAPLVLLGYSMGCDTICRLQ